MKDKQWQKQRRDAVFFIVGTLVGLSQSYTKFLGEVCQAINIICNQVNNWYNNFRLEEALFGFAQCLLMLAITGILAAAIFIFFEWYMQKAAEDPNKFPIVPKVDMDPLPTYDPLALHEEVADAYIFMLKVLGSLLTAATLILGDYSNILAVSVLFIYYRLGIFRPFKNPEYLTILVAFFCFKLMYILYCLFFN